MAISRIHFILFFLFVVCFVGQIDNAQAKPIQLNVNKIVAVVNGEAITMHELRRRVAAEIHRQGLQPTEANFAALEREGLDAMVNDILLRHEAERFKLSISEAEITNELRRVRESMGNITVQEFEKGLIRQGTTLDAAKEQIKNNMLRQRMIHHMISRKVVVTDQEISDYYEANKSDFATGKTADFSMIAFPPKFNVKKIYQDLNSGAANFEAVARQYSLDQSAQNGGRIGEVAWGAMSPNMRQLLSSLSPGQLSPIISFEGVSVVVRLNNISDGRAPSLEEARPHIEQRLKNPRMDARFKEYTDQLRKKAVVDVRM